MVMWQQSKKLRQVEIESNKVMSKNLLHRRILEREGVDHVHFVQLCGKIVNYVQNHTFPLSLVDSFYPINAMKLKQQATTETLLAVNYYTVSQIKFSPFNSVQL